MSDGFASADWEAKYRMSVNFVLFLSCCNTGWPLSLTQVCLWMKLVGSVAVKILPLVMSVLASELYSISAARLMQRHTGTQILSIVLNVNQLALTKMSASVSQLWQLWKRRRKRKHMSVDYVPFLSCSITNWHKLPWHRCCSQWNWLQWFSFISLESLRAAPVRLIAIWAFGLAFVVSLNHWEAVGR